MREFVNYRHPDPRRVWKGGSELQSLPPFPGHPLHPLHPVLGSFWVQNAVYIIKNGSDPPRRRQFSLPGPSQAQSRPKALTRDAKGRPRHPKVSQRESNGMQKWANGRDGSTPTAQSGKSKHKKEEKNNKTRYIPKLPINRPSGRF